MILGLLSCAAFTWKNVCKHSHGISFSKKKLSRNGDFKNHFIENLTTAFLKNLEICDCTFVVNFLAICILPWNISLEIFQNSQNYLLAEHFRVTSDYAQSDLQNYSSTNTEPLNTFWKVKPFFKPWRYFFKSLESTTKLFFPLLI